MSQPHPDPFSEIRHTRSEALLCPGVSGQRNRRSEAKAPVNGPRGISTLKTHVWFGAFCVALLVLPGVAYAQTDEIQVYDGGLAGPGIFNLTLHTNFTPSGVNTPAFPGAVVADKSLNGVSEWALGVNRWFEVGVYLPLVSRDKTTGWGFDGVKLRALFALPDADDRTFFCGANFEFSYNAARWDSTRITSEVRPIIGWHLKAIDIIVNPILDTAYNGLGNLDFAPAVRVAYNVSPTWAMAVEEYADFGPVRRFHASGDQSHMAYGVLNYNGRNLKVEAGIGVGLTAASDKLTLKLLLSRDLNTRK